MRLNLFVKINNDTNYIPIKYLLASVTVGSSLTNTYCFLVVVEPGWDTEENYNNWKQNRSTDGMQGKIGDFYVTTMSQISSYYDNITYG